MKANLLVASCALLAIVSTQAVASGRTIMTCKSTGDDAAATTTASVYNIGGTVYASVNHDGQEIRMTCDKVQDNSVGTAPKGLWNCHGNSGEGQFTIRHQLYVRGGGCFSGPSAQYGASDGGWCGTIMPRAELLCSYAH